MEDNLLINVKLSEVVIGWRVLLCLQMLLYIEVVQMSVLWQDILSNQLDICTFDPVSLWLLLNPLE